MPNCKEHTATGESTRYLPMTRIFTRRVRALVWNWTGTKFLRCHAFQEETAEGNFVRASRIEISTRTPETNCKKSLRPKRNESNLWEKTCGKFPLWPCTHAHHNSRGFANRVVLRRDIVKDEEYCRTVFAQQGQQQNFWIQFQNFLNGLERHVTQFQRTLRLKWQKVHDEWNIKKKNV